MNVFRADNRHLDELADLFDQYRQFYEQDPDLDGCREFLEKRMNNSESVIFAARLDGEDALVGFTQLYPGFCSVAMAEIMTLYDLFVAPVARRKGVGRALMEAATQYGQALGVSRLQLETAHTNIPGQTLYESLGWERDIEFYTYHYEY